MNKIVKKAIILTILAFLSVIPISVYAESEKLYILDNLITNGDFSDSDNNWNNVGLDYYISDNELYVNLNDSLTYLYQYINADAGDIIYFSIDISLKSGSVTDLGQFKYNDNGTNLYLQDGHYSNIFEITTSGRVTVYCGRGINLTFLASYDNILLINLTKTFGAGYEPSIDDFETLYLPEGYFEHYETLTPESYRNYYLTNYDDLSENLDSIDYSKSVISNYGDNVDIDIFAYVYSTDDEPIAGWNTAHYIAQEHPVLQYMDKTYTLDWEPVDYSLYVIHLKMSDVEKNILKRILFNRYIDKDNEFFSFNVSATTYSYTKLWFELSNVFDLKVHIGSVLISHETTSDNEFSLISHMYYKFYDLKNNLLLPSPKMYLGSVFRTELVPVNNTYTDVSKFTIALDVTSPDENATDVSETHYFYELGIFSMNDVFIPSYISDSELGEMFPTQICDVMQFGCHATNLFNNIAKTVYKTLNVNGIISTFDNLFNSINNIWAVLPEELHVVIVIVLSSVGVGITFVIVERLL